MNTSASPDLTRLSERKAAALEVMNKSLGHQAFSGEL